MKKIRIISMVLIIILVIFIIFLIYNKLSYNKKTNENIDMEKIIVENPEWKNKLLKKVRTDVKNVIPKSDYIYDNNYEFIISLSEVVNKYNVDLSYMNEGDIKCNLDTSIFKSIKITDESDMVALKLDCVNNNE